MLQNPPQSSEHGKRGTIHDTFNIINNFDKKIIITTDPTGGNMITDEQKINKLEHQSSYQ